MGGIAGVHFSKNKYQIEEQNLDSIEEIKCTCNFSYILLYVIVQY